MSIQGKWAKLTKENIKKWMGVAGVYEVANKDKKRIYKGGSDGETTGVGGRVKSHKRRLRTAKYFRARSAGIFESGIGLEAQHAKIDKRKGRKKPRYTSREPRDTNDSIW